ncbi:carbon-nitrogen family hydrolase [Thiocapsa marina]|nr:carbon-nitrogen family hydrolase [Thiocapsa marina]
MPTRIKVALAQMDIVWGDPAANLAQARSYAIDAARRGADVIVLPELWSTGYDLTSAVDHAEPLTQGIFAETARLARTQSIAIVGSCLARLGTGRIGNTAVYIDAEGRTRAIYSKTHLFRLMNEHRHLTPGSELAFFDTGRGMAGLAICYDLRFPELFRCYALAGADVVFLSAEWPHPRGDHWRTLVRARAIENQMFIVACNRAGRDPDHLFCGSSCVIDPTGAVLAEADEHPALLFAELDLATVSKTRADIPVFADRRPELYS